MSDQSARYDNWVQRYVKAWNSNDPNDVADLFTPHARYFPEPFGEPWLGVYDIVEKWIENKDEPGDTEFKYEVIAATPEVGIIKGRTYYRSRARTYANLWEVRLGHEDRCREFVEWWIEEGSR